MEKGREKGKEKDGIIDNALFLRAAITAKTAASNAFPS